MSDQYIGEIRTFGFNFAPYGWFLCNGQILSIQAYTTLFAVIGTYFGGNGTTNFQLPNLQGSVPMHWGNAPSGSVYDLGEPVGTTNVTLNSNQAADAQSYDPRRGGSRRHFTSDRNARSHDMAWAMPNSGRCLRPRRPYQYQPFAECDRSEQLRQPAA